LPLPERIARYQATLDTGLGEGDGRDDIAYRFAAWLTRDMALSDAEALTELEAWDAGNVVRKGRDALMEIIANVRLYGRQPEGCGLNGAERNGKHTSPEPAPAKESPPSPAPDVNEAVDDPHRLARLYLDDHAHPDGRTLHWWREEWHRWDSSAYRVVKDKEVKAELTRRAKHEFDEVNRRALAAWEARGGERGGEGRAGPGGAIGDDEEGRRCSLSPARVLPPTGQPGVAGVARRGRALRGRRGVGPPEHPRSPAVVGRRQTARPPPDAGVLLRERP
jgi:hypothetical protein